MLDLSNKHQFLFLFFLFLLVLTPLISAQPFQPQTSTDLQIQFSKFTTLSQNEDHTFFFHTINETQLLSNDTIECDFDLFHNGLENLYSANDIDFESPNQWSVEVLGGNFSELGEYSYIVSCNSTVQAGFTSVGFDVTGDGKHYRDFPNQFFIILLAFVSVFGSYVSERLNLFRYLGSLLLMVIGVITLYPGYNFINYTNLQGMGLGMVLISLGFYFLIEDSFSRDREPKSFRRGVR